MTREKLEFYRQLMNKGTITKEEFLDIQRTYETQRCSFIELDGQKQVRSTGRRRWQVTPSAGARGIWKEFSGVGVKSSEAAKNKRRAPGGLRDFLNALAEELEEMSKK